MDRRAFLAALGLGFFGCRTAAPPAKATEPDPDAPFPATWPGPGWQLEREVIEWDEKQPVPTVRRRQRYVSPDGCDEIWIETLEGRSA